MIKNDRTLIKTQLIVEIFKIFKEMNVNQDQFSKIIGTTQNKVSRMLNNHLYDFSMEQLIIYLQNLDKYVEIKIHDCKKDM